MAIKTIDTFKLCLWFLIAYFTSIASGDALAYMGNFQLEKREWLGISFILLFLLLAIGLGPTYFIYKKLKKKQVFWLTPIVGLIIVTVFLFIVFKIGFIL